MKSFLLILSASLVLAGCSGLTDLAKNSLYPFEDVNKAYPSPEYGSAKYPEFMIDGIHGYKHMNPESSLTIVYCQGNGENLPALVPLLGLFEKMGVNFVVVDYPSMGLSIGEPSESSLRVAARIAIGVARREAPSKKLVLWGRSLGAGVALQAFNEEVDALIVLSGWTTFEEAAKALSPLGRLIPKKFLEANKYDSLTAIKSVNVPTLIMHGTKDDLIPFSHGVQLQKASEAQFLQIENAGHNDVFGRGELWDSVKKFLYEVAK